MKKNWRNNPLVRPVGIVLGLVLWVLGSCQTGNGTKDRAGVDSPDTHHHAISTGEDKGDSYTCPMHPQIVRDKPGPCPICGMALVKKVSTQAGTGDRMAVEADLKALLQPTSSLVVANIATVAPIRQTQPVEIKTNGIITYDTRRLFTVPARFGGRIEKLYVRVNYQPVRKGQKLLELYSPDIVATQRELLYLLTADAGNAPLIGMAKEKLRLLGLTSGQIATLIRTRQPSYSLALFSPYDGYIIDESAPAPAAPAPSASGMAGGGAGGGMAGGDMSNGRGTSGTDEITFAQPAPASSGMGGSPAGEVLLREGQYVQTGQTLFRVVNAGRLWAEFRLYARDADEVKPGDPLTISFDQSGLASQSARVSFVVPFLENGSSFVTIRAYLPGGQHERVGQLARAVIRRSAQAGLWIPQTAVLDLGRERVAFVKQGGAFKPVRIKTGVTSGELIAVTAGLAEGQPVAKNAQFLIDSESFVNISASNE